MSGNDGDSTYAEFKDAVNLTRGELERWLATDESRSVGVVDGQAKSTTSGRESVGHESGRHIVRILDKRKDELDDDDYAHMRKVIAFVHRHLAQRPSEESGIEGSRWRHSLMNWGHDPLRS